MTQKPVLAIQHKVSLSVGGIVRYRIKVNPSQINNIDTLQFRIRNCSPIYRNLTPASGPWKISVALIRNPDKTPVVPELVPSIGCAKDCRLDAKIANEYHNNDETHENDPGENEWELEVLSEMVLQPNWINITVELYAVPQKGVSLDLIASNNDDTNSNVVSSNSNSSVDDEGTADTADTKTGPQVLLPHLVSCDYKDTNEICGPTFPKQAHHENIGESKEQNEEEVNGYHLVVLTHGIHGSWLDLLYMKEQIDAYNAHHGKTVTFLSDTNHGGTEEGIQSAGQRVALDILEFTGYNETEQGKELCKSLSAVASKKSLSKSEENTTTLKKKSRNTKYSVFPRGISKISIIGHSLGGLVNIYMLGYIEDVTKGVFFNTIQPVHFITLATPLLGIGFEHPWVLGLALSMGCIGQTGKDLTLEDRSSKLKRSSSTFSLNSLPSSKRHSFQKKEPAAAAHAAGSDGANNDITAEHPPECALDHDPEPLLLAMARPGSVSNRILKQFSDRTSYANIENDMAVRFKTSTMMGIPKFDVDHFFSSEGAATQPKRSLYHNVLTSTLALLFPPVPKKAKFLSIADAPSPIVIVSHVEAEPGAAADVAKKIDEASAEAAAAEAADKSVHEGGIMDRNIMKESQSADSLITDESLESVPSLPSSSQLSSSSSAATIPKSRMDLAHLVAEGYHAEMDWTKIGVYIEHEAHVQIIVRRKWYNLDGWKCVQDLVERFDFT
ncbi:hypothetical protein BX616_001811 [Lobosporangium transversale]|uniref:Putative serine esterase-domain-containing protein n=1 Tax=Lobosporangium transversale TaxID=64571 RepID=A0A1Y2GC99_9FUNG|nr:putative serine esterase-domain-containing protein [Lobosporangium transversale]KAF9902772.1 hypothetical protein BX616_001811 [Lobosporangium transversale]ORZ05556.1 putative serine esterase-domain-containing protein [Lobosporangium transversale]|eukprot:XP_021877130.1 putative serine esterase-domain-containing protein [Lobosporangium transversale]